MMIDPIFDNALGLGTEDNTKMIAFSRQLQTMELYIHLDP